MEAFDVAYRFMTECVFEIRGIEISLWQLFLFLVVAEFLIWLLKKFFL